MDGQTDGFVDAGWVDGRVGGWESGWMGEWVDGRAMDG